MRRNQQTNRNARPGSFPCPVGTRAALPTGGIDNRATSVHFSQSALSVVAPLDDVWEAIFFPNIVKDGTPGHRALNRPEASNPIQRG